MIARHLTPALRRAAEQYPVVTLTGPRQSGKTTLVRAVFPEHRYAPLELRSDRVAPGETLGERTFGDLADWLRQARESVESAHEVVLTWTR